MNNIETLDGIFHQVDVKDIDDRPGPYCMSFGFNLKPLTESIKRVGLVNSPLLIRKENENLDIITGYRRIHAMKSLGWDKIPCRILSKADFSPLKCLLLNFHDNISCRKFNDVEKGMVLSRLSSQIQRKEILNKYMPILDLPSHEPTLDFYLRIDKDKDDEIKTLLIKGVLSLFTVKQILQLNNDAKSNIAHLISKFKFNVNQQKQLLEYLNDISYSEKKEISDILEEQTLKTICSNTQMNNPQKVNSLLKILKSRIYPRLTEAEKIFRQTVSVVNLPEGVKIQSPPFFEAPHYRMEIHFEDGKELKKKIEILSQTKGLLKLHDPWEKDL